MFCNKQVGGWRSCVGTFESGGSARVTVSCYKPNFVMPDYT